MDRPPSCCAGQIDINFQLFDQKLQTVKAPMYGCEVDWCQALEEIKWTNNDKIVANICDCALYVAVKIL